MTEIDMAQKTRREHERLGELTTQLQAELMRCGQPPDNIGALRNAFSMFRAHLYKQLALEEDGGYMEAALCVRPTLSVQLDVLRDQHRDLLRRADAIEALMGNTPSADDFRQGLGPEQVNNLFAALSRHEQEESFLLSYAFTEDLGAAD